MLEPQSIKSTERAKRFLIPPVYFLRGIRACDELQIVVTEVGQVTQTVTLGRMILMLMFRHGTGGALSSGEQILHSYASDVIGLFVSIILSALSNSLFFFFSVYFANYTNVM